MITCPEESYRLWSVIVCDQENLVNEEAMGRVGLQRQKKVHLLVHSNAHKVIAGFFLSPEPEVT
jgi:hypothetical protein